MYMYSQRICALVPQQWAFPSHVDMALKQCTIQADSSTVNHEYFVSKIFHALIFCVK